MKYILIVAVVTTVSLAVGQQPRQATLAQQKVCAEEARKTFHADNATRPPHTLVWEYTSHYEPRTNTCYIMTHFVTAQDKSVTVSHSVYDAIEGRGYASFIEVGHDVMDCSVSPPGQDKTMCKTSDEFERLVDKNFGIGR